jgi:hypothetical protein
LSANAGVLGGSLSTLKVLATLSFEMRVFAGTSFTFSTQIDATIHRFVRKRPAVSDQYCADKEFRCTLLVDLVPGKRIGGLRVGIGSPG